MSVKDYLPESVRERVDEFASQHRGLIDSTQRGWAKFTKRRIGKIGLAILGVMIFVAVFAPFLAPHPAGWTAGTGAEEAGDDCESLECRANSDQIQHPAPPKFGDPYFAPLGTDNRGQGILTQLIFGTRTALYIGLAAGILSSLVGVPLGLISGYYGDTWIDETIQRVVDVMYGLPFLPLVIVLIAVNGITTTNIVIAIAVKSWLNNAIVIRGETLSIKERQFIESAEISGASRWRIITRYIFPNVLPLSFIYLAQDAAFAVLTQASLAFLGLADVTNASWGLMLQRIRITGNVFNALWWLIPPGLMIAALAASFYFIGYSLEDVMNPHERN